ncbi:MAG TPA: uroporphyrinogen decarboxylase family protein [Gaiellaceae bacterium]|nr:uroporphyrinogen decarboxylase family protein [Gaiellaceae bacterium]HVP74745.1 uroporphyrinogen decarboxylase family protein [Gaiellaceae bacterium]
MNGRERILGLIRGEPTDCLPCMPITMMFAGDFAGVRYVDYATDHRVQAAAQRGIAEAFDLDHVSVISDPCCEAADCGGGIVFYEDEPPAVDEERSVLRDRSALASLRAPDPHRGTRMSNRLRAVTELADTAGRERLVEGWIEGPCSEAADLRGINRLMLDFFDDPDFVHELVDFVVELGIAFGRAQVEAGAEVIGIGDPTASLIGPALYEEFIWPGARRLVAALHDAGAICRVHICGNSRTILPLVSRLGCEIVDVDSLVPMAEAREAVGAEQVLCGNLDPVRSIHDEDPATIRAELAACHREAGARHVVGAGCEIPRGTPLDNFRAIVDFAHARAGHEAA